MQRYVKERSASGVGLPWVVVLTIFIRRLRDFMEISVDDDMKRRKTTPCSTGYFVHMPRDILVWKRRVTSRCLQIFNAAKSSGAFVEKDIRDAACELERLLGDAISPLYEDNQAVRIHFKRNCKLLSCKSDEDSSLVDWRRYFATQSKEVLEPFALSVESLHANIERAVDNAITYLKDSNASERIAALQSESKIEISEVGTSDREYDAQRVIRYLTRLVRDRVDDDDDAANLRQGNDLTKFLGTDAEGSIVSALRKSLLQTYRVCAELQTGTLPSNDAERRSWFDALWKQIRDCVRSLDLHFGDADDATVVSGLNELREAMSLRLISLFARCQIEQQMVNECPHSLRAAMGASEALLGSERRRMLDASTLRSASSRIAALEGTQKQRVLNAMRQKRARLRATARKRRQEIASDPPKPPNSS